MNDIITIVTYLSKITAIVLSTRYGLRFFLQNRSKTETIWYGIASLILYVMLKV